MKKVFKLLPLFSLMLVGLSSCNTTVELVAECQRVSRTERGYQILVDCAVPFSLTFTFKKNHKLTEDDLNDIYGKIQTETPQRDYTYTFPLKIDIFGVFYIQDFTKDENDYSLKEGDILKNDTIVYYYYCPIVLAY